MKWTHRKGKQLSFLAVVGSFLAGITAPAQEKAAGVKYLLDMSKCQPAAALSQERRTDRWRIISYETTDPQLKSGKIIGAASYMQVPEVRLPLGVSGWHAVYVGYWNPYHAHDGGTTLKLKLGGDACFTRINEPRTPHDSETTWLNEVFFTTADLTGRDLLFGKVGGPFAQKVYIAYVKLVPLSSMQVDSLKADRARQDTRLMHAVIDGINFMGLNEYKTREHILEVVERYRHSDVSKVVWGVMSGDSTSYLSKWASYFAGKRVVPIEALPGAIQPRGAGESMLTAVQSAAYLKIGAESMRELASKGIIPAAVAAEHVHQMGLKFDLMFRLGIRGNSLPPMDEGVPRKFLRSHPEYRQVLADGTVVDKASYAYPEVRQFALSIIREAAEIFDCDGVNLAFVRGPEYVMYEKPVLDAFQKEYGRDGRKVSLTDPDMLAVRSRFLNQFVRDSRQVLNEVGTKKGKKLELSAYVFSSTETNRNYGLDVVTWMKEGLLDSIYFQQGKMDKEMIAAAKANQCKFILEIPGGDVVKSCLAGYEAGVDGVAQRDIDGVQDQPSRWAVLSRAGHRKELQKSGDEKIFLNNNAPELKKTTRLKKVGGIDVLKGFWHTASSG